jgi:hypothetical protein
VVVDRKLFKKSVEEKISEIHRLKQQLSEVESSCEKERAALAEMKKKSEADLSQ